MIPRGQAPEVCASIRRVEGEVKCWSAGNDAARAAGVTPILVRTGYGRDTEALPEAQTVPAVDTLADAVALILAH